MSDENNKLENLLQAAFEDHSKIESLYAALLSSQLFVLTPETDAVEGKKTLEKDTNVSIINFEAEDGTPFIPAFTSLPELQRTIQKDYGYIAMDGWNLFSLINDISIVINPASEYGIQLDQDEIRKILEYFGSRQHTVEKDTPVLIGRPKEDPLELKKSLAEIFERDGRVQSAYLCLMVNQEAETQSLLVGVVFRPGQENRDVFSIAGPAASKHVPPGQFLDFIIINDNNTDGVAGALLQDGDHFFSAKTQA